MAETLLGRVYGRTYDALRSVGIETKQSIAGTYAIGDFDQIKEVENWDANGTWIFYWKGGECF